MAVYAAMRSCAEQTVKQDFNRDSEGSGTRQGIAESREWVKPTLVRLSIRQTRSGFFCAPVEDLDSVFSFLVGTDPNCVVG